MSIRHKYFIWGLLFALPVLFITSPAMASHSYTIPPEMTRYGQDIDPWYGLEADTPWEIADREREPNYRDHKQRGYKRYEELSPEQRKKLRQRRDDFNALPRKEQERIHQAREKFRNMPPEKREKLKEKWRNMSPEERDRAHKNKAHKKERRSRRE